MSDHDKIYEKLTEISNDLAVLKSTCPNRDAHIQDLEKRVREMKAVQDKAVGIIAFVSIIFGAIGNTILTIIKKGISSQ